MIKFGKQHISWIYRFSGTRLCILYVCMFKTREIWITFLYWSQTELTQLQYINDQSGEKVVMSYVHQPIRSKYVTWAAKVGRWDDNYWLSTVPIQSYSKILATHHRGVIRTFLYLWHLSYLRYVQFTHTWSTTISPFAT